MQRENFKSRTGFLLVSAGCAIGIGNVWRFPYVTGENGGGLFVLFYLAFLVLMGIPVLTMELAVGRASRKSAVLSYKTLEKPKSKWHIHGWLCMIGCYLLMMFYTPVSAWMLDYFYKFATGTFKSGMNSEQVSGVFNNLMASPVEMIIWLAIIVARRRTTCQDTYSRYFINYQLPFIAVVKPFCTDGMNSLGMLPPFTSSTNCKPP